MLVTQKITTFWTKKSRGMPFAKKRNETPRKLALPDDLQESEKHLIHEVFCYESKDFELYEKIDYFNPGLKYWSFSYAYEPDNVKVFFTYDYYKHGKPDRGSYKNSLFKILKGQIGVFWINGRFTSYSGQYYMQHCVNIAWVDYPDKNIFIALEPTYFVDKFAHLF